MPARSASAATLLNAPSRPLAVDEWNAVLDHLGREYKQEMSKRSVIESELIPVSEYVLMAHVEDYLRLPGRLRTINRHCGAEELFGRGLPVGSTLNFMGIMATVLHYFSGREILINSGDIDSSSGLQDHLHVLEFARRALAGLHASSRRPRREALDDCCVLGEETTGRIAAELVSLDAEVGSSVRRFGAVLSSYCFLEACDSRLGTCDTGPYPVDDEGFIAVRELNVDIDGRYPWTSGVRHLLPHHQFVIAYRLPNDVTMKTNVWGTAQFTPRNFLGQVAAARVYAADGEKLTPLAVAELEPLTRDFEQAQAALYRAFAEMSRHERMLCGALMYSRKTWGWAVAAGCADDLEWELSPRTLAFLGRELPDTDLRAVFAEAIVPADRASCFRPLA